MRNKLSVTVITYNEEAKIHDALASVKWADEIVVVDSYSTDRTVEVCKGFTDKVYFKEFIGFGGLKNLATDMASHDWVLNLDSDERVTDELRREIEAVLSGDPDADGYAIPRKNYFLGRWVRHCGWYPDYRSMQLFHRKRGRFTDDLVHERFVLNPGGRKAYLKGHIIQHPFLDLKQFVGKNIRYAGLRAEELLRQGRTFRFYQLLTHPAFMFLKMYVLRAGFLDGAVGLIIATAYTYFTFVKYACLWELTSAKRPGR